MKKYLLVLLMIVIPVMVYAGAAFIPSKTTDLDNWSTTAPSNGQIPTWDNLASKWTPTTLSISGVSGPGSSTNNYVPQWNGTGGNSLKAGVPIDAIGGLASKAYVDAVAGGTISITGYGAVGDGQQYMDGTIAADSTTLTTGSSHFVPGDVGKTIAISDASSNFIDLTTYTKTDPNSYLSVINYKVTATNMPGNTSGTYLEKDYGASYLSGNFTEYVDFDVTNNTATSTYVNVWSWGTAVGAPSAANGNNIFAQIGVNNTLSNLWAIENYNGTNYNGVAVPLTPGAHYWITMDRTGSVFSISVYSDSGRTTLVGTSSITLQSVVAYQYSNAISSLNNGIATTANVTVKRLSFVAPLVQRLVTTISGYTSGTQVTLANPSLYSLSGVVYAWGTDNTTPIQNAINAGQASGSANIVVPYGRYLCSGSLTLYNNITLRGAATGPFYPYFMKPSDAAASEIPQLWILNNSDAFVRMFSRSTGTTTNGNKVITGIPDTSKLFVGELMSAYRSTGEVPYAVDAFNVIVSSIDSASQIHTNTNGNYSGMVNLVFGITSAGVEDILFYYPVQHLQTSTSPEVYPATIQAVDNNGSHIKRCTFINSYRAIDIGAGAPGDYTANGSTSGLWWIQDLMISSFQSGITFDHQVDVPYVTNIFVTVLYELYGPDQPLISIPSNLDSWGMTHPNYVITLYRCDNFIGTNIFAYLKYGGLLMSDSPDAWLATKDSYGQIINLEFDTVVYGARMYSTRGAAGCIWSFTNAGFRASPFVDYPGIDAIKFETGGSEPPGVNVTQGIVTTGWTEANVFNQNNVTNSKMDIRQVYQFNPRGKVGPPAVPASATALKNPYPHSCRIYITGGTVSNIAIGGNSTGLTSGTFELAPNETITLTYTGAPTWTWFGL